METKEIKQIFELVSKHDVAEFKLEKDGSKLHIKKYADVASVPAQAIPQVIQPMAPQMPAEQTLAAAPQSADEPVEDPSLHTITSPIVGTFYAAASPDSDPFVTKGQSISTNDTICIVEAMKVMNEIKAEVTGTIAEILVENGQAVEFGQPLMKVRK